LTTWYPFLLLAVGLFVVVGGIIKLRVHAFIALITAALVVSLLAPGDWGDKVPRVAQAFGDTATGIGVVIALAAVIGMAMTASGAADRVVRMFLRLFGQQRGGAALMASGFTLAIPVFFDTVFFLLVPLVRSMYRRTGRHYLKYLVAAGSCAVAHALVPPTPGPLIIAGTLGVDLGMMMLVGLMVAIPAAFASLLFAAWVDRRVPVTPPSDIVAASGAGDAGDENLPGLGWSLAPIVIPVGLITAGTIMRALGLIGDANPGDQGLTHAVVVLSNPNMALLLAAAVALLGYWKFRRPTMQDMSTNVGEALMAGGVIVLITCAGGAFGAALRSAQLAPAIQGLAGAGATGGYGLLFLGFGIAMLIKFAQGSSTASMIVTSAMLAAMLDPASLAYHPVYVGMAIGSGSLIGSWMNDSGFWIFARMGGLTELQTLKSWTPLLVLLGLVGMAMTLLLATVMPMA